MSQIRCHSFPGGDSLARSQLTTKNWPGSDQSGGTLKKASSTWRRPSRLSLVHKISQFPKPQLTNLSAASASSRRRRGKNCPDRIDRASNRLFRHLLLSDSSRPRRIPIFSALRHFTTILYLSRMHRMNSCVEEMRLVLCIIHPFMTSRSHHCTTRRRIR